MCESGGIYWSKKIVSFDDICIIDLKIARFYYWWAYYVLVYMANDDQWHYKQCIPYNLRDIHFFLVTSSNYKASLFSYESSMLLNRWIDHDDSFCTSLTCFVTFDFFYRWASSCSSAFFLLFLLISLCSTTFEHSSVSSKMKSLI